MQVRVTLFRPEDNQDRYFLGVFINLSIDIIDDTLYRRPLYVIRGKNKQTITFYGLSRAEAETVKKIYARELQPDGDGVVTRVIIIESSQEEDTGPYMFAVPEIEDELIEDLEDKGGFMRIIEYVGRAIRESYRELYREIVDKGSDAPLSAMAFHMALSMGLLEPDGTDQEELIDYITEEIVNEPMYREQRPRRPRAPRKPRNRSARKKTASHPHKTKTGNPPL